MDLPDNAYAVMHQLASMPVVSSSSIHSAGPLQANIWIAIFSYIGNYFWTHYFFNLLGAAYTFPSYKLNQVSCTLQVSGVVPLPVSAPQSAAAAI